MFPLRSYQKQISVAFVLALLLSFGSYNLAQIEHNTLDEFDSDLNWDFDTNLSLSTKLTEYSNQLLRLDVYMGYFTGFDNVTVHDSSTGETYTTLGSFGTAAGNLFSYNVSQISANYYSQNYQLDYLLNPDSGHMDMTFDYHHPAPITSEDLAPAHEAFALDIKNMQNMSSLEFTDFMGPSPMNPYFNQSEIGDQIWEITHIYTDGTIMEFYIYNSTILFRKAKIRHYISGPYYTQYGVDPNQPMDAYIGHLDGEQILPNYISALNALVEEFYHE